ncbi:MAG: hypothetical protein JW839_04350 [Candidatus Lokiarchaeota archaeon]|nr:hypothetical protein [Candidatus Lokiarchaeota archaeon]
MSDTIQVENASDDSKGSLKTVFRIEKQRFNWIDQGRGLVMFLLVLTESMPDIWRKPSDPNFWTDNPIIKGLAGFCFDHPPETAPYMNLYDIGVPAFFFIIGLLMAVSFKSRMQKKGTGNALLNSFLRWGLIFVLGLLIILFTWSEGIGAYKDVVEDSPDLLQVYIFVVSWDVIFAIGCVGLIAIPFMFLPNKARLIVAYLMMAFYQVMVFVPETYWRWYALASVHGGVLGGVFVLTPILLVGSCVGEYFIMDKEASTGKKYKMMALLAAINLSIGIGLWLIPGGFPNKRQSTMGYATISMAAIIAGLFVFIFLNLKKDRHTVILEAYGMNPFLVYAIAAIPTVLIGELISFGDWQEEFMFQLILWIAVLAVVTLIVILLYRKGKAISTTKIVLGLLVILLPLGVLLKLLEVI